MLKITQNVAWSLRKLSHSQNLPNNKVDCHRDEAVEQVVPVGQQSGHELPPRPETVEEALGDARGEEGAADHVGEEEEHADGGADLQAHGAAYHEVDAARPHLQMHI